MIHPEWTEVEEITTSRDIGNKKIKMFKSIQASKMKTVFFEKLLLFFDS